MALQVGSAALAVCLGLTLSCGSAEPLPILHDPATGQRAELVDDASNTPLSGEPCTSTRAPAQLTPGPVDVLLVLDNSSSMQEELRAIERNINDDFASILQASGSDYRVVLLSQHRTGNRTGSSAEDTAICITEPLSSLQQCPAREPGFSERFFHYSTKIESTDSLQRILATYSAPDPEFGFARRGWSQWLRPTAKKVFLEVSDDDASMSPDSFVRQLVALSPGHFGPSPAAPSFVFHSIVGLREKSDASEAYTPSEPRTALRCRSETARVINPGLNYQQLSRITGGLRFPLCQIDRFDTVFNHIATDVLRSSGVTCSFPIPEPPDGRELQLDQIEIEVRSDTGVESTLQQVLSVEDCGPDAFLSSSGDILLCPEACRKLNASQEPPEVDVRFACEPRLLLR